MPAAPNAIWHHYIKSSELKDSNACKHCEAVIRSHSIPRLKAHQRTCPFSPLFEVQEHDEAIQSEAGSDKKRKLDITAFVDRASDSEQSRFEHLIAKWIFRRGLPLSIVEQEEFVDIFKLARPCLVMPSRRKLSEDLLDSFYEAEQQRLLQDISEAERLSLITDGWTNIRNEPQINYMVSTGPSTHFYKSISTEIDRHTADNIAAGIEQVIEELGSDRVFGLTTDNANNMTAAWQILRTKYPRLITIGCCAHRLNLLANDLIKIPRVNEVWEKAQSLSRYFKSSSQATEQVKKQSSLEGTSTYRAFQLSSPTRWQGKVDTIKSVIINFTAMQAALLHLTSQSQNRYNTAMKAMKQILDEPNLLQQFKELLRLCLPILQITKALESRQLKLSLVYPYLRFLERSQYPQQLIHPDNIFPLVKQRLLEAYHPIMALAFLADPTARSRDDMRLYVEEGLVATDRLQETAAWMAEYHGDLTAEGEFLGLLISLRDKNGPFKNETFWNAGNTANPLTWWTLWSNISTKFVELCKICFILPPTSGEVERNWSTFGNIHSKLRNRLTNDRVHKLVFLNCSLKFRADGANRGVQAEIYPQTLDEFDMDTE